MNKGLIATLVATFITFLADGTFHDGEGKTSCFADLFFLKYSRLLFICVRTVQAGVQACQKNK